MSRMHPQLWKAGDGIVPATRNSLFIVQPFCTGRSLAALRCRTGCSGTQGRACTPDQCLAGDITAFPACGIPFLLLYVHTWCWRCHRCPEQPLTLRELFRSQVCYGKFPAAAPHIDKGAKLMVVVRHATDGAVVSVCALRSEEELVQPLVRPSTAGALGWCRPSFAPPSPDFWLWGAYKCCFTSAREAKGPGRLQRQKEDKDQQTLNTAIPVTPGLDPELGWPGGHAKCWLCPSSEEPSPRLSRVREITPNLLSGWSAAVRCWPGNPQ